MLDPIVEAPVSSLNLGVAAVGPPAPIRITGPNTNRVTVVFMGDGYTEAQLGDYRSHLNKVTAYLFSGGPLSEPLNRYANFFNVYALDIVSRESGADDKSLNQFRDTALGAAYFHDGVTERSLNVDFRVADTILWEALAGTGIRSHIRLVPVNSQKHGGSADYFATYAAGSPDALEIALHEIGHAFAGLADHYSYAGSGGYGGQKYTGPEVGEADVTRDPSGAKWARWLGYDQPGVGVIGAYEGARYFTEGLYRPSQNSKMLNLGQPFDAVGREQFILGFYRMVDPLDAHAPTAGVLTDPTRLWVDSIDPAIIKVRWSVDGRVLFDGRTEELDPRGLNLASGAHAVTALAYDDTDWVRVADRSSLEQRVVWNLVLTIATLRATAEVRDLVGGALTDLMFGAEGADTLAGGAGDDHIVGAGGGDRLLGEDGADLIGGQDGDDFIDGGDGRDNLFGDAGADHMIGGGEGDRLHGQEGDDLLGGQDGDDYIDGGPGRDRLYGDTGGDHLVGGADGDELHGQEGDDLIGGQDGDDHIDGGDGRDNLFGDAGADHLNGGADGDRLHGQDGDDLLGGQDGDDFIEGGDGRDNLFGDAGGDHLIGGLEADRLHGQDGDDLIGGQEGDDFIDGGDGRDTLYGDGGDDLLVGGAGDDRMDGGDGVDTAAFSGVRSSFTVVRAGGVVTVSGLGAVDTLVGVERLWFDDGMVAISNLVAAIDGGAPPALDWAH